MKDVLKRIAGTLKLRPEPLGYDEEKRLAQHGDIKARTKLAARDDVRPEILYYLAEDPSPEVRRRIAANANTPRHADLILARDDDDVVRTDLAGKIAHLAPGLSANEQESVRRMTYEILEILARDQLPRVRRILVETLKDLAEAPYEIIGRLARDTDVTVAGPVLRSSPVLTDADLIEIIRSCTDCGLVKVISQRRSVGERVSDAIAGSGDVDAIGALLANPSAQIREETLDRIIDDAPEIEAWHAPLVRRPKLSQRAVTKIARFVAHSLVDELQARGDLAPATVAAVRKELSNRLEREVEEGKDAASEEPPLARAQRLKAEGNLIEKTIADALASGDRRFVGAALAVLANLPLPVVEKVAELKSARGITAVCWKAGLGMRFGTQLQIRLAHIAPQSAINPVNVDQYPLTPEEMEWQLDFFGSMVPPSPGTP